MPQFTPQMTDHALVVELMVENMLMEYDHDSDRLTELSDELERRYPGANERLAQHVTGCHMTSVEAVAWAGAHWESSCRATVTTPTAPVTAWVVEQTRKGRVRMQLCTLNEAMNAVNSVKPDQLITDAETVAAAFALAKKYHPGPGIAAYIVHEGDSITIAV